MSMNERYEPQSIETRWQTRWEEAGTFRAGSRPQAESRYVLEMFPYPSGAMHMGHARVYTIGDALARWLRMRGYDVLHPIGFDALGLPAENAAIKDGRHPAERTAENIVSFRAEMKRLGYSFDWDREVTTSDPAYYRWNQWFFVKMLEKGIVYRRQGKANWCTGCMTVIANEQEPPRRQERAGRVGERDLRCLVHDQPVERRQVPGGAQTQDRRADDGRTPVGRGEPLHRRGDLYRGSPQVVRAGFAAGLHDPHAGGDLGDLPEGVVHRAVGVGRDEQALAAARERGDDVGEQERLPRAGRPLHERHGIACDRGERGLSLAGVEADRDVVRESAADVEVRLAPGPLQVLADPLLGGPFHRAEAAIRGEARAAPQHSSTGQ